MRFHRNLWPFILSAAVILLVSAVLRFLGAQGDLWLDEIWTLNIVSSMDHAYLIFWGPYLDNNHFLNTFYIYLVGTLSSAGVLRGLAIATGIASVVGAGLIGLRRSRREALINMLLFGLSYALVHYASEARGYGPMILFILLGFYWLDAEICAARKSHRFLFAGAVVLGFLSHPIFVAIIASFGFWFFFDRLRSTRKLRCSLDGCVEFFLPAVVLFGGLFISMAFAMSKHGIAFGGRPPEGGEHFGLPFELGRLFQYEFGVPLSVPLLLVAITVLVVSAIAIAWLMRRGDSRAWFYLATVLLVPAALFVIRTPIAVQPRYLILTSVPVLLLTGQCLAWATRTNLVARAVAGVFLGLFVLGNSVHLNSFLEFGRGSYSSAVQLMEQNTAGQIMTVGGTSRFRTLTLLDYYNGRSSGDAQIHYIEQEHWGDCAPQWLIVPGYAWVFDPAPALSIKLSTMHDTPEPYAGTCPNPDDAEQSSVELSYALKGVYRNWGLSGWHWALYRRS